jgi:hypothetical protein
VNTEQVVAGLMKWFAETELDEDRDSEDAILLRAMLASAAEILEAARTQR